MYVPKHFEEPRVVVMHELIRARPLATVVTLSSSGLNANHIPLHLAEVPAPFGSLQGHIARANPIAGDLRGDVEALAIFNGPNAYISPSWYATKRESGKVVPTWNYAIVHAYGFLRIVDDPAWLRAHLEALTSRHEASLPEPWSVSDAPADYVDKMIRGIVGIEMVVTRMVGKWKISQNHPIDNREGVAAGLRATGLHEAETMAALFESASIQVR